jgi:phospholipid transport system substrate-binding protein
LCRIDGLGLPLGIDLDTAPLHPSAVGFSKLSSVTKKKWGQSMSGLLGSAARAGRAIAVTLVFTITIMAVSSTGVPAAQTPGDAGAFLLDLSQRAKTQLNEPGISKEEREQRFRDLLHQGFDVEAIARFILGRYWRVAKEPERQEFLQVFEDSLVFRFLPVFGDYADDALQIGNVRPFGKTAGLFNVETELTRPEGPPVRLNWRVHKGPKGYRILDVLAEGVSVAVTLRSEYGSVLKQNGGNVSALNKTLRKKFAGL